MKIVHVVPHVDREASGPSYSVPRLCQSLAALGHDVELSCLAARGDIPGVRMPLFEGRIQESLMHPLRVRHISPSFFPATRFGGPIFSTKRLCDEIVAMGGVDLRVETTNTSGEGAKDKLAKEALQTAFHAGYMVNYCNKWWGRDLSPSLLVAIVSAVRDADVVHLTGVYSWPTLPTLLCCALFDKPLVWSPRGSLQTWVGSRRRRVKAFWVLLCNAILTHVRAIVHVTSKEEAGAARAALREVRTAIIPNGVDVPREIPRVWLPNGILRIVFLGRIDPIKGIENLLLALARVKDPRWSLTICGAGATVYEESLTALARELHIESRVRFAGHVEGEEKDKALAESDVCVIPSHTENFGMVVAEALARGVPAIASQGTPWEGLVAHRCGYWVENSPESLGTAIDAIRTDDVAALGANGRRWMQRDYGWPDAARQMLALYREHARDRK